MEFQETNWKGFSKPTWGESLKTTSKESLNSRRMAIDLQIVLKPEKTFIKKIEISKRASGLEVPSKLFWL